MTSELDPTNEAANTFRNAQSLAAKARSKLTGESSFDEVSVAMERIGDKSKGSMASLLKDFRARGIKPMSDEEIARQVQLILSEHNRAVANILHRIHGMRRRDLIDALDALVSDVEQLAEIAREV